MELKTAKIANELITEIGIAEKKIKTFNNTKEFCNIEFKGNENDIAFILSFTSDKELVQKTRTFVADELKKRLEKSMSELNHL